MLTHLHIQNFTLVEQLDIELAAGLTAITGETGAGKSIMLDALGLTLGDRSDAGKVRVGAERADIHASFDIRQLKFAQRWLKENDLGEEDECILRRVITADGRSRAYINGQTVTLGQLKALGERLIDIHSQHEHQSLLDANTHRRLLDDFAGLGSLAEAVKDAHTEWQRVHDRLTQAQSQGEELNARFQLLHYQVEELDQLGLEPGELEALEGDHTLLAHAEKTQSHCQHIIDIFSSEGVGIKDRMNQALRLLHDLPVLPEALREVHTLVQNALISVDEAQADLDRFIDSQEMDGQRLHDIELRLDKIYEVARKHRVQPEEIVALHQRLAEELRGLSGGETSVEKLGAELDKLRKRYDILAAELSDKRHKAAKKLAAAVNKKLTQLAMEHACFSVDLRAGEGQPARHGCERIEFLISTNPMQPAMALQRVASGGELSRISLAIQVVTAQTSTIPTLVFDEVDVGIGGTTGDVVGAMLRELGERGQVFCVTHLAQVASKAHHHLRIEKHISKKDARSSVTRLDQEEKIMEIARMMGGDIDAKASLEHARQMLALS